MGRRGPKPEPTVLALKAGKWRGKLRAKTEAQPAKIEAPRCPADLTGGDEAKAVWRAVVPDLAKAGLLARVDRGALERYCATFVRWRRAERLLQEEGESIELYGEHPLTGEWVCVGMKKRPEASTVFQLAAELGRLERAFGLTPADRAGLKPTTEPKETHAGDSLLRGRGRASS